MKYATTKVLNKGKMVSQLKCWSSFRAKNSEVYILYRHDLTLAKLVPRSVFLLFSRTSLYSLPFYLALFSQEKKKKEKERKTIAFLASFIKIQHSASRNKRSRSSLIALFISQLNSLIKHGIVTVEGRFQKFAYIKNRHRMYEYRKQIPRTVNELQ